MRLCEYTLDSVNSDFKKFVADLKQYRTQHLVWHGMDMQAVRLAALTLFVACEQLKGTEATLGRRLQSRRHLEWLIVEYLEGRAAWLKTEFPEYQLDVYLQDRLSDERDIVLKSRMNGLRLIDLSLSVAKSSYDNFYIHLSSNIQYHPELIGDPTYKSKGFRSRIEIVNSVVEFFGEDL